MTDPTRPSTARRRVLLLPLEFCTWGRARAWSYGAQLAVEEGLRAHGATVDVAPAYNEIPSDHPGSWLYYLHELYKDRCFDQVWMWVCHTHLDDALLQWLSACAPVRIGVVMESVQFAAQETLLRPDFLDYGREVRRVAPYLTHVCTSTEGDVGWLERKTRRPTLWWPGAVPRRLVWRRPLPPDRAQRAGFFGNPYGERAAWLARPDLRRLMRRVAPPEDVTDWPRRFDDLLRTSILRLGWGTKPSAESLSRFVSRWRSIRRRIYDLYVGALSQERCVVALPGYVKAHAGRVVEGMAAGRPVVAAMPGGGSRTAGQFADGRDVLLYDPRDPGDLASKLREVRRDPGQAERLATRGFDTVRRSHTIEHRVEELLAWVAMSEDEAAGSPEAGARCAWRNRSRCLTSGVVSSPRTLGSVLAGEVHTRPLFAGHYASVLSHGQWLSVPHWPDLLRRLRSLGIDRPIYCWGAGARGDAVLSILRSASVDPVAFIDSDPRREGASVRGVPVVGPHVINRGSAAPKAFIIVTTMFREGVIRSLKAAGMVRRRDWWLL